MEYDLGHYEAAEEIGREMYENGPGNTKDMNALHALSGLFEDIGKYHEAEVAAREVYPWLQERFPPRDGASPQTLGCMKVSAKSLWRQGYYLEAQEWMDKCDRAIDEMDSTQYAKYQKDERRDFNNEMFALKTT